LLEYKEVLYRLVSEGYFRPSSALSHISPREKLIQYEVEEVGKKTGFLTAKELRQAKEAAWARVQREEQEEVREKTGIVSLWKFCRQTSTECTPFFQKRCAPKEAGRKTSKVRSNVLLVEFQP
jgi:hypothetical protein